MPWLSPTTNYVLKNIRRIIWLFQVCISAVHYESLFSTLTTNKVKSSNCSLTQCCQLFFFFSSRHQSISPTLAWLSSWRSYHKQVMCSLRLLWKHFLFRSSTYKGNICIKICWKLFFFSYSSEVMPPYPYLLFWNPRTYTDLIYKKTWMMCSSYRYNCLHVR